MVRYRWFQVGFNGDGKNLPRLLLSEPFRENSEYGFISHSDPFENNRFRFAWKTSIFASSFNNEGEVNRQQIFSFSFIEFSIREVGSKIFIRIKNPTRSLLDFWNAMEKILGFGFWVKPIDVVPLGNNLIRSKFPDFKLIGLKLTNVLIGKNILARMEFVSKQEIIHGEVEKYLSQPHTLEFSAYEIFYQGTKAQISFHRTGLLKVSDNMSSLLTDLMEKQMEEIL